MGEFCALWTHIRGGKWVFSKPPGWGKWLHTGPVPQRRNSDLIPEGNGDGSASDPPIPPFWHTHRGSWSLLLLAGDDAPRAAAAPGKPQQGPKELEAGAAPARAKAVLLAAPAPSLDGTAGPGPEPTHGFIPALSPWHSSGARGFVLAAAYAVTEVGFFFFLMFSGLYLKKKKHHGISTGFCHFPERGNKVNSQGFSEVPGCAKGCVLPGINCQALVEVREALEKQPGKCGASHLPRPKAKNTQGTTSELLQSPLTAAPAAPAPPHREFPQETRTASPPRPARLFSVPSSKEKRDEG